MKSILKVFLSIIYLILTIVLLAVCIEVKDYLTIKEGTVLICLAVANLISALIISVNIDYNASFFECPLCGKIFKPSLGAYIFSTHTAFKRHLKCPKCKEKSMCRVRYSDKKKEKKENKKENE